MKQQCILSIGHMSILISEMPNANIIKLLSEGYQVYAYSNKIEVEGQVTVEIRTVPKNAQFTPSDSADDSAREFCESNTRPVKPKKAMVTPMLRLK
jgi:hypothetical protein